MKWSDIALIAAELHDRYPELNPMTLRFTDLHNYVVDLPGFDDDHSRGGEKVLEAIQMAWMDEAR